MTWKLIFLQIWCLSYGFLLDFSSKPILICQGYHIATHRNRFSNNAGKSSTDIIIRESGLKWLFIFLEIWCFYDGFLQEFSSKPSLLCQGYHIAIYRNCFSNIARKSSTDIIIRESGLKWPENSYFWRSGACHMDSFSNLVQNQVYLAIDIISPSIEIVFQISRENLALTYYPRIRFEMTWKLIFLAIWYLLYVFLLEFSSKRSVLCHGYYIAIHVNRFSDMVRKSSTDLITRKSGLNWSENSYFWRSGACHMDSFSNLVQNQVYFAMDTLPSIETIFKISPANLVLTSSPENQV